MSQQIHVTVRPHHEASNQEAVDAARAEKYDHDRVDAAQQEVEELGTEEVLHDIDATLAWVTGNIVLKAA